MMVAAVTSSKKKPIKSYSTADESRIIALLAFPYISIVYPTVKALLFVASISSSKKELGSSFQTVVEEAILSIALR